jgi:hypothetical protein
LRSEVAPRSDALTTRYHFWLRRLAQRSAFGVGAAWDSTDGIDDAAAETFSTRAQPVALAAQRRSVALADAYLAAWLSAELRRMVRPRGLDIEALTGEAVRNGGTDVYRRSIITARAAITRGRSYSEARAEGRARAVATASTDVALSARAAVRDVMASTPQVVGYRRVIGGKACVLCIGAQGIYASDTLMPIHDNCTCGVEPVMEGTAGTAVGDGVKVVEHGELGPLLWQANHEFAEMT